MEIGRKTLLPLLPLMGIVALVACGPSAAQLDETQWHRAEALWKRGEADAYQAWRGLAPQQRYGRQARDRLERADILYRRAVEELRANRAGVRETLLEALALAPMDPALYLPFARACRARGTLWRAADFYRKFLAQHPPVEDANAARRELFALAGDRDPFPLEFEEAPRAPTSMLNDAGVPWHGFVWAFPFLTLLGLAALLRRLGRHRVRPLRDLVLERPELHQTVAYQIGCLRHEFLKHRIGAAAEALRALARGRASPEQRKFLEERLCRGEPLLDVWRMHVTSLERTLGLRFPLTRGDPFFRDAQQALAVLTRAVKMNGTKGARRLEQAVAQLEGLDRDLSGLVAHLTHCRVDDAFLRHVLDATRSEWASGKVELDEIVVGPVPEAVAVDVYATDLRIVLKNLLRNAISALDQSPHPRRLAIDLLLDLEPTGEEIVRIRVRDSSNLGADLLDSTGVRVGVEHGLGIVRTALLRYDGSLEVAPAGDGYAKAVMVRLFRSQGAAAESVGVAA